MTNTDSQHGAGRRRRRLAVAAPVMAASALTVSLSAMAPAGADTTPVLPDRWASPGETIEFAGGDCVDEAGPGWLVLLVFVNDYSAIVQSEPQRTQADAEGRWSFTVSLPADPAVDRYILQPGCRLTSGARPIVTQNILIRHPSAPPPAEPTPGPAPEPTPEPSPEPAPAPAPHDDTMTVAPAPTPNPAADDRTGEVPAPRGPSASQAPVAVSATPRFTG
jgi:hypothetical protein